MTAESNAAAEEARRGRKRGKHNFEPGYKDLLCKEWTDFTAANNRCPKLEEIEEFSKKSFLQRRKELAEEDPDHPLLVILESPLDATQVKNLINNEKKKRQRMRQVDLPQGSLPFAALQGLPVNDAAMFVKEWLKNAGQQPSMCLSDAQTLSPMSSPLPKFLTRRQESTSVSDQSCDAGLQKTPGKAPHSPPTACETPMSKARRLTFPNNTLSNAVTAFQDMISEDESETHDSRSQDNKASALSGITSSMATLPTHHRRRFDSADAVSPVNKLSGAEFGSKIVQCTAAEALHKIMMKANQEEVHTSSVPAQLVQPTAPPSPMQSPPPLSLGPSAATVSSTTAGAAVQQSIAALAMNSCNQSLLPILSQSLPVNVLQIQEVVKSIVDEQVQKLFAQQQLHAWQQKQFQEQQLAAQLRLQQQQQQQQQRQQHAPPLSQLLSVLQLLQGSQ